MAKEISKEEREERKARRKKKKKEQSDRAKSWFREWMDAFLFAVIAAIIIRTFMFEAYRIPTPSMENTLLTGDFLVVSKLNYGPRTPMVLGIPFTNIYLPGLILPWTRLPGFDEIERNDIVVFNYPINLAPIAVKTNYIKRLVGIPGDTLRMVDKQVYVNGEQAEEFEGFQGLYAVEMRDRVRLSPSKIRAAGGTLSDATGPNTYRVNMSDDVADSVATWPEVVSVRPFVLPPDLNNFSQVVFNFADAVMNRHHMPPIVVPFEGQQVTLTEENWPVYENIITRYEGNNVDRDGGSFTINGEQTDTYTIRQDYYFMMGDNRDNSEDSRYWGFVPHDHIVGKAGLIYFSWDSERWLPRFDRILNFIHD